MDSRHLNHMEPSSALLSGRCLVGLTKAKLSPSSGLIDKIIKTLFTSLYCHSRPDRVRYTFLGSIMNELGECVVNYAERLSAPRGGDFFYKKLVKWMRMCLEEFSRSCKRQFHIFPRPDDDNWNIGYFQRLFVRCFPTPMLLNSPLSSCV